jgi:hypothetical protein
MTVLNVSFLPVELTLITNAASAYHRAVFQAKTLQNCVFKGCCSKAEVLEQPHILELCRIRHGPLETSVFEQLPRY